MFIEFDKSAEGYVSSADKYIVIKNLSHNYPLKVTSITFAGCDLVAHTMGMTALQPGQSVKVKVTGDLPKVSNALIQAKVNYETKDNTTSMIGEKVYSFKVMNGVPVTYDEQTPFVGADYIIGFEGVVDSDTNNVLINTGVAGIVSFFYDWFMALLNQLGIGRFLK